MPIVEMESRQVVIIGAGPSGAIAAALLKAEEALAFYEDKNGNGYDVEITDYGLSVKTGEIIKDAGDRARATLTEIRKLTGAA